MNTTKTTRTMARLALWSVLAYGAMTMTLRAEQAATPPPAAASAESAAPAGSSHLGLYAVGVGLIMLGGALGTGLAQKGIGAAVTGAVAEDKKFLGTGLILLALPETILFICAGFAYLLFSKLH